MQLDSRELAQVWLCVALGLALGVGGYTFLFARGASYMTDDASACANCHVMESYYSAWLKSSHHSVAVCNDCHTPAGLVPKYATKTSNGFWHSFAFTTGRFPDPLQIKPHNYAIAEQACHKCHQDMVEALGPFGRERVECIRCHTHVGHLE